MTPQWLKDLGYPNSTTELGHKDWIEITDREGAVISIGDSAMGDGLTIGRYGWIWEGHNYVGFNRLIKEVRGKLLPSHYRFFRHVKSPAWGGANIHIPRLPTNLKTVKPLPLP